ncbi:MAG: hypothetical protein IRZ16_09955 [Myxococcaceae bacterium]|nr:hypothetical protein [Myxococcaceae bacterium]
MRGWVIVCTGALFSVACTRVARPPELPKEIFAGEPVRLGSDGLSWQYGDGASGTLGTHAYRGRGTFTAAASRGGEALGSFEVTVVPRSVLRAVPPDASQVLWLPAPRQGAGAVVDFLERAAGGFFSTPGAERDPFLRYLQELSAQPPSQDLGVDRDEGLAVFGLPGAPGRIAAVGVVDEAVALRGARDLFAADGFHPEASGEDEDAMSRVLEGPDGERIVAFADRGYLYLMPVPSGAPTAQALQTIDRIRTAPANGLEGLPDLAGLRARVASGDVFAWFRAPDNAASAFDSALVSFAFSASRIEVDAAIAAAGPLWDVALAPEPGGDLFDAADDAQLLIVASADPAGLGRLIDLALALWPRRVTGRAELDRGGGGHPRTTPGACAAKTLRGDLSFGASLDIERSLAHLAHPGDLPDLVTDWTLLAGVRSRNDAYDFLNALFEALSLVATWQPSVDTLMYDVDVDGRIASAMCCSWEGALWFSTRRLGDRADVAALRRRFGEGAFSRGHLSVLLDLGALMRKLQTRAPTASTFLEQLTAVDTVFVDVVPESVGGRARAVIDLRPE